MHRFQDEVLFGVYFARLLLRGLAPQEKDDFREVVVDDVDNHVGELGPAAIFVRVGFARLDSENRVQQEHALRGPLGKVPVVRGFEVRYVGFEQLVDIL